MSDSVAGKKQLTVVRMHINSIFASLFNIMVHLQGPTIFYATPSKIALDKNPDSGSVVLMCVELLTRIAGKRAQYHLDTHHIGQFLHIPATLSKGFRYTRAGKASQSSIKLDGKECEELESHFLVDRQFSMNIFAASCQLLWTVVKHRKRYKSPIFWVSILRSLVHFPFLFGSRDMNSCFSLEFIVFLARICHLDFGFISKMNVSKC